MDMNRARLLGRAATGTVSLLASVAVLTACGSEQAGAPADPAAYTKTRPAYAERSWRVESLTRDDRRTQAPARARLAFDAGGRAQGNYGCNSFSARVGFRADGGRLRITDPIATKKACTGPAMDFEKDLAALLTHAELKAEAREDRLTLTTPEGDTVTLGAQEPRPLTGTTWEVTTLTGGEGTRRAAGDARLRVDEDGTVHGTLGCNGFSARAEHGEGTLRLDRPASTRKLCPGAPMDTERALLALFTHPLRYEIDDRTLRLTADDGTGLTATAREE